MARVALAGGNGFVGRALTVSLCEAGYTVVWLSHRPGTRTPPIGVDEVLFDPDGPDGEWCDVVRAAQVVVNLSGHPIASRWNRSVKQQLCDSRIMTTRALVDCIGSSPEQTRPSAFVCASGIGYYGDRGGDTLDELEPPGSDWLATLAVQWESEAQRARTFGCRAVSMRTGLALGDEGLLPKMLLPMRMFVGGPLGSGRQWMPWIHIDDLVSAYRFVIEHEVDGAVNACAPHAVTMREFAKALGTAVHRPSWFPVPQVVLRVVLGEVAPYTLMSQRAAPAVLARAGFRFRFTKLETALSDLIGR